MNRKAVDRILNTLTQYISYDYDDLVEDIQILDLLCEDLKRAIHADDPNCVKCEDIKS